jgi:hypothetical protein
MDAFSPIDSSVGSLARLRLDHITDDTLAGPKDVTMSIEEVLSSSGFLDFPREIRDLIYALMFISPEPIYPTRDRASVSPYMNILRTNKQIYSEILPFLYGKNTFQLRGHPAYKSPEFLNVLHSQRRRGYLRLPPANVTNEFCLARHHLKRLNIPSHGISLDRLKHFFSLLKHFPNLEHIQVVYLGKRDLIDMDVINVCRLLKDRLHRLPLLKGITLLKRINYSEAEDISWTVHRPYYKWMPSSERPASEHCWISPDFPDLSHYATIVTAPQRIPE